MNAHEISKEDQHLFPRDMGIRVCVHCVHNLSDTVLNNSISQSANQSTTQLVSQSLNLWTKLVVPFIDQSVNEGERKQFTHHFKG